MVAAIDTMAFANRSAKPWHGLGNEASEDARFDTDKFGEEADIMWNVTKIPLITVPRAQAIVNPINGAVTYQSIRNAPQIDLTPAPHLVNDGKANTQADQPGQIDARRRDMMAYLKPAWS
jgi:hypothetical protein